MNKSSFFRLNIRETKLFIARQHQLCRVP